MTRALLLLCPLVVTACAGDPDHHQRGRPCSSDADCASLRCIAPPQSDPEDLAALPMVCGDLSGDQDPGEPCEEASQCGTGICLLAGACARACETASTCGAQERCQAVFARTSSDALQTLTACVARLSLPAGAPIEAKLDSYPLAAGTNVIELPSAPGQRAALYVLEHAVDDWPQSGGCRPPLCVRELRTLDTPPRLLFSTEQDYATADPPLNPLATGVHLDPAVILLPSGDPAALSAAGYALALDTEQAGELQVTRLVRADPRSEAGQQLDLNLFYVGASRLAPEGARGPAVVSDALEVVDEILGQADIFIGEVRQIQVGGDLPKRGVAFPRGDAAQGFAVLQVRFGVYAELPGLFRLSAGAGDSAVNLFFVKDIAPRSGDGEPQAEAGGIPGPLGMQGTGSSGIAIAADMMAGNAERLGRTLAHELGHYLGLFHTSESDGNVFEGLSDTPECRKDRDLAGDGIDVADCEGAGADNLMFWSLGNGTSLTPEQRAVLRSALVLH